RRRAASGERAHPHAARRPPLARIVSSEFEMHAEVSAVIAKGERRQRGGFENSSLRRAIVQAVAARRLQSHIAQRAVAVDDEENDRRRQIANLRPQPVTADQRLHPLDVQRVWKISTFERRHSGAADRNFLRRGGGWGVAGGGWGFR